MREAEYTSYAYDEETDLGRIPYWIFGVSDTPPGHPRTPMFDWLFMNGSNWGASYACDKLSIPSTKALVFRSYRGYQFLTVVVPKTDEEVGNRTEKFKDAMRLLIENYDHLWTEAKARLIGYIERPRQFDFDKASWFEMSQLFRERIDAEREMYAIYHYFATGLGAIYADFERVCSNMLGIGESHPLFQKLLAGFDNDSYRVDRGLYALSMRADELGLRGILLHNATQDVMSKMEGTGAGRQWVKELRDFLYVHGWRSPLEMEYLSPSWAEDPALAVGHLQKYLEKGGALELDGILSRQARERTKAEETLVSRVPVAQRDWFIAFMRIAQKYAVWNVEHAYYCQMYQYSMTRHVLMGVGERISRAGCIEKPEDTLFLIPEEILKALSAPEASNLKPVAKRRRETWEKNRNIVPPPLIARISPEAVAKIVLKSKNPMAARLIIGKTISGAEDKKADLAGEVCSPGVGEGPARVIFSEDQLGEIQKGDILVAPAIWSSWSPVFSLVKGIVTDRGGTLSSSASVGREYGIPVLTNVIDGTSKIKTGQRIRVDANIGTVHIVDSLHGKRVLAVDDEPDVLELLEELLPMCDVVKAASFDQAKHLLETKTFDVAIMDIMGVDGYALLEIAKEKSVLAVMLTAHALTLEDTVKSYRKGAASYIPKEEMIHIVTFLNDVLTEKEQGRRFWLRWFDRFGPFYEKRFGPDWQNKYPEFWEMFAHADLLDGDGKKEKV
jgi:phosphohistidine swiveling domain-containing protein